MMVDSGLPCFSRGDPIGNLRKRFHPEMSDREAANFMIRTCIDAYNKWTTAGYDLIQYLQQGIEQWKKFFWGRPFNVHCDHNFIVVMVLFVISAIFPEGFPHRECRGVLVKNGKHGIEVLCNLVVGFLSRFVKVQFIASIYFKFNGIHILLQPQYRSFYFWKLKNDPTLWHPTSSISYSIAFESVLQGTCFPERGVKNNAAGWCCGSGYIVSDLFLFETWVVNDKDFGTIHLRLDLSGFVWDS